MTLTNIPICPVSHQQKCPFGELAVVLSRCPRRSSGLHVASAREASGGHGAPVTRRRCFLPPMWWASFDGSPASLHPQHLSPFTAGSFALLPSADGSTLKCLQREDEGWCGGSGSLIGCISWRASLFCCCPPSSERVWVWATYILVYFAHFDSVVVFTYLLNSLVWVLLLKWVRLVCFEIKDKVRHRRAQVHSSLCLQCHGWRSHGLVGAINLATLSRCTLHWLTARCWLWCVRFQIVSPTAVALGKVLMFVLFETPIRFSASGVTSPALCLGCLCSVLVSVCFICGTRKL